MVILSALVGSAWLGWARPGFVLGCPVVVPVEFVVALLAQALAVA